MADRKITGTITSVLVGRAYASIDGAVVTVDDEKFSISGQFEVNAATSKGPRNWIERLIGVPVRVGDRIQGLIDENPRVDILQLEPVEGEPDFGIVPIGIRNPELI